MSKTTKTTKKKRTVANPADLMYIKSKQKSQTAEEISEAIGLSLTVVKKHYSGITQKETVEKNIGRSKIKLRNGGRVFQMTDDLDEPVKRSPQRDQAELDAQNGIYRLK